MEKFEKELLESPDPKPDESGYIDLVAHFGRLCNKIPNEKLTNNVGSDPIDWNWWGNFAGCFLAVLGIVLTIAQWIWAISKLDYYENLFIFNEINGKLADIDSKLTNISSSLVNNFSALLLKADLEEIRSYTTNIGNFKSDYVQPIADFGRNLNDVLENKFKKMAIDETLDVEIPYMKYKEKISGDKYAMKLSPISKIAPKGIPVEFEKFVILRFTKSKKYISSGQPVDEKFIKEFKQDILDSIKGQNPDGLTEEEFASDVFGVILENTLQTLFCNSEKTLELEALRDLVINYIKQLYSDDLAIVSKYVNRCKLSYNFASETEKPLRTTLASSLFELERNAALAQLVCRLSGDVNELELVDEYLKGRKCIKDAYKNIKNLPSNYCFRDEMKWETKFFRFDDKVDTHNQGTNISSFTHTLQTRIIKFNKNNKYGTLETYDRKAHPWADSISLKSMTARYAAITKKSISLLDYLYSVPKLINPESNKMLSPYCAYYGKKQICCLLGDFSTRFATEAQDKGKILYCVSKGAKPRSKYFYINTPYEYLNSHKKECWKNGTFYTADFIDMDNGNFINQKDLIMYCDYLEDHELWNTAENFAFSGGITYTHPVSKQTRHETYAFGLGIEVAA